MLLRPRASLAGLSEELIERIFSSLQRPDFLALACVCRPFHRIVEPLLYRNVVLATAPTPDLMALVDHPHHTADVHHATVEVLQEWKITHISGAIKISQIRRTVRLWESSDYTFPQARFSDLVSLALQQMPALQSLDLRFHTRGALWGLLHGIPRIRHEIQLSRIFPRLQCLRVRPFNEDEEELEGLLLETMEAYLGLPRIAEISMQNIVFHAASKQNLAPHKATSLRMLVLKECQLEPESVAEFIKASPQLRKLECSIMINAKHASGWYDIGLIRDTLAVLQQTLEHLQISIILFTSTAIDIGNPGPWGIRASLGDSLRLFSKLRKLEISLPVLLGWNPDGSAKLADILPDCLEELVIGREMDLWYGYKWDDQSAWSFDAADCLAGSAVSHAELKLRQYLQSKPTGLRKITIIMEDGLSEEDDMRFKNSITQEAEKVGVDVEFNEDSSA